MENQLGHGLVLLPWGPLTVVWTMPEMLGAFTADAAFPFVAEGTTLSGDRAVLLTVPICLLDIKQVVLNDLCLAARSDGPQFLMKSWCLSSA